MIERDDVVGITKQTIESLENIKSLQKLDYKSVVTKKTMASGQYDFTAYIAPGATKKYILDVYTASGNTAIIDFKYWYSISQPDVLTYAVFAAGSVPSITVDFCPLPPTKGHDRYSFTMWHNPYATGYDDVYMKFMFTGTDDITWTMTQV